MDEQIIKNLNYLLRTYDGQTELIKQTKQRIQALNIEAKADQQDEVKQMESLKGKISRKIEKQLDLFPVYTEWLKGVPGVGPFIAGNVIMLYYYKFLPVCPKCGGGIDKQPKKKADDGSEIPGGYVCLDCHKKLKGEGLLKYKVGEKDFPTISKFWKYMGREIKDGKMTKRAKGSQIDWSPKGRVIGYQFGDQVNRQKPEDSLYASFMYDRKAKREKTHPDASKGHKLAMAKHETIKLFLSHFWTVARSIDGKPVSKPYSGTIMGHTNLIDPFYMNNEVAEIVKKQSIN